MSSKNGRVKRKGNKGKDNLPYLRFRRKLRKTLLGRR